MRQLSFAVYVTDSLQLAGQQKYLSSRWAETLKEQDTRTGDEIALEVLRNSGLRFEE